MQLMKHYRSEYMNEVAKVINDANQQNTQYLTNVENTFTVRPAIPKNMDVEQTDLARKVMNRLMMN